ncbi:MAG TPA: acetyl-CoA hydrolase/transferase C-terminal domain-containing protein [Candidatus Binataceae bacterium]|nr:acetyl-CoA hydrolase/transferase C-terminal domain-containing protein [Candidatus Binataceae bacterium]
MHRELDVRNLDFTGIIRPGDHVVWAHASGEPQTLVEQLLEQRHRIGSASVFLGGSSYTSALKPSHADVLTFMSCGAIGSLRELVRAGAVHTIPCHLSQLIHYFDQGILRSDVVFVQTGPPNENGDYSFSLTNDYLRAAIARARVVVAEVNEQAPSTYCDSYISPYRVDYVVKVSRPPAALEPQPIGQREKAIARHVGRYIEDGSTIQIGIGAIPDAVMASIGDRRDLGFHSGLISDRVVDLIENGAITNARKPIDKGVAVACMILGTRRLYRFVHRNPAVMLFTTEHTHRAEVISQLGNFVSINSAVEVDLTGQVNAEVAGGVYVGTVGGQVDFVRGAQLAANGHSVIALPSTARNGKLSRIVSRLSGPVTTARSDTDIVVTEFGAAELRGQPVDERVRRMIAIAHPDFRDSLEREAIAARYIAIGGSSPT